MRTSNKRLVCPPRRNLSTRRRRGRRVSRWSLGIFGTALFGLVILLHESPEIWDEIRGPSVTTCFTPAQDCVGPIVRILNHAQFQIRVQAYGFTSAPILTALVAAKRRGVDIAVILDKSDDRASPSWSDTGAKLVAHAGIPVFIDYRPAIAHNKVIVVDKHIVITGSYNFTAGAENRNAENVAMIGSFEVASRFLSNWESRREVSRPFVDEVE